MAAQRTIAFVLLLASGCAAADLRRDSITKNDKPGSFGSHSPEAPESLQAASAPRNWEKFGRAAIQLMPSEPHRSQNATTVTVPNGSIETNIVQVSHPDAPDSKADEIAGVLTVEAGNVENADSLIPPAPAAEAGESGAQPLQAAPLTLDRVIENVYQSYPLLEAALYSRDISDGEQMAASGEFDLKFKAASENGPTGFYQTYRQSIGVVQPTYSGGEIFAGYRIGRGDYQPWYLERETNDGGEFKAGVAVPLSRNRNIDSRRAELWRTTYGRQRVEPEIQAQLVGFVQEAGYAYWEWVAAGRKYFIAKRVLALAEDRTARIKRQVDEMLLDPPELTDNLRMVAERRVFLADAARKVQQSAAKLSVYVRDVDGNPRIPAPSELPAFPAMNPPPRERLDSDVRTAIEQRPELRTLDLIRRQLDVDLAEAHNELRPAVDAVVSGSQDTGAPTSDKRDKSEFELEAALFVEVPIQRRKARGKMAAVEGKQAQLAAKRQLVENKIVIDVQTAYAALEGAYTQATESRKAVKYAEDLAERERRSFELGASDSLKVSLREQYAAEAALKEADALLQYFRAEADYRAALAEDRID